MKNLFNSFYSVVLLALCLIAFSNCSDSDDEGEVGGTDNGITAISSETEKTVSLYGETVEISFTASGKWTPSLQYSTGSDWAAITNTSGSSAAGKGGFRVKVDKNEAGQERILTVLVQVEGYKTPEVVCTITQSGSGDVSSADIALNEFMHNYLKEHYLFKDEYNTLEVDCKNVSYDNFLSTYLLKMKTNTEDGGISRAYSVNAGQRYIYSYIEKVGSSDTRATTRATSMVGTGLGTFFSSYMADRTTIGLSIGYVFVDSPAAKAGLRRGDVIVAVNGVTLNKNNYQQYMNALYYASGGESFNIGYRRYVPNEDLQKYELVDGSVILTTGTYNNNPVLYSMFIKEKEGNLNVAYLVYQGFDLNYAEELKYMIQQFKTEGITDLILDLRYNYGGAVELSRYLSASIAGSSHRSDVFMRMQRSSGADEYIRFGDGDDLGLNSIRIICSEETASSSELVISGLRGIDFPVKLFGSRTEGKNVGMEVQEYKYGNSYYEFAPITFRSFNAKDWGDYADGIEPDVMLNNQNADYTDDIDNAFPYAFGDWDNFDFNLPLWYALCDIQGVDPNTGKAKVRSGKMKMERPQMDGIQRLPSVSVKRSIGTFGSLIYNKPEVENLY